MPLVNWQPYAAQTSWITSCQYLSISLQAKGPCNGLSGSTWSSHHPTISLPHLLLWPLLTLPHHVGLFAGPGAPQAYSWLRPSHFFPATDALLIIIFISPNQYAQNYRSKVNLKFIQYNHLILEMVEAWKCIWFAEVTNQVYGPDRTGNFCDFNSHAGA